MLRIDKNGDRFWHNEKGELHRDNGPALEWIDGAKMWFLNDHRYSEDEYRERIGEIC